MDAISIEELSELGTLDDPVDHFEPLEVEDGARQMAGAVLARVLAHVVAGEDVASIGARAVCLAESIGLDTGFDTQSDLARASGLTRAAISKAARGYQKQFNLPRMNGRPGQIEARRRIQLSKGAKGRHE